MAEMMGLISVDATVEMSACTLAVSKVENWVVQWVDTMARKKAG